MGRIRAAVGRHILICRAHLINSIVDILLAQASHGWRLDVALVQLQGQGVGRNNRALITGHTVVVSNLELRAVLLRLLVVESQPIEVHLLHVD